MEPMQSLILLVVGADRPGLVRRLAERVQQAGGNWLESRFAHLAGHFAGVARVEVPASRCAELESAMRGLAADGLTVTVTPTVPGAGGVAGESWWVELVGHDRPGIVHQVSAVLQRHGVNIEELETGTEQAAQTNDRLFRARARVTVPLGVKPGDLRRDLEAIAAELMVDLTLQREGR
ncbi:MAG: ACT domain-containing protein [Verrucomicrobiae bacterium]|nr:ACT domain-containing protein [Verrucomicrobiae bacterium]